MKNISQKIILMVTVLVASTFIANAQSNNTVSKTNQTATQQATPEKFFNVQSLDDAKSAVDVAQANYKQASKDQSEAMHNEYLKARRMYTVELEKQMAAYDKTTPTGQKVRAELRRINTTE